MRVRVLVFGALKDLLGPESEAVDLPEETTVEQFLQRCLQHSPAMKKFAGSLAIAVNREYASMKTVLRDGDEVALLPPVSGGSAEEDARASFDADVSVSLQREPIVPEALLANWKQGEDGAVVVFDGIVRNNTRGRPTLYLDYQAYEAMALERMRSLAQQARQRYGIRAVLLAHRLGRLEIGESSVWIAVASAHRGAAFDACRWIIDTLKKTVPIWKKEYFRDGAVWADGEPFPAEIALFPAEEKPR